MDWKITRFGEITKFDRDRLFYRGKKAYFTVDGTEHTLKISMKDFDEGRTSELVAKEAQKIISALQAHGSGIGKDK